MSDVFRGSFLSVLGSEGHMNRMRSGLGGLVATGSVMVTLSAHPLLQQPNPSPAASKEEVATGPGKETFVRACGGCHLTNVVTAQRKTADGWTDTVVEMRNRGANATDEELEQIVQYLATNYSPKSASSRININAATASDISLVLSVPQAEAEAIVAYRNKNGKFKDIAALKLVPTLESTKIDAAKDRIDF